MKKYIEVYHYSNVDITEALKPDYYGNKYYTNNDCNITSIKRIFFYTEKKPEYLLKGSKFLYTARIPLNRLYNLTDDKRGFLIDNTIHGALCKIKQKYNYISYKIGNTYIVNSFYDVKFTNKELLK